MEFHLHLSEVPSFRPSAALSMQAIVSGTVAPSAARVNVLSVMFGRLEGQHPSLVWCLSMGEGELRMRAH